MSNLIVYHGGIETVEHPICLLNQDITDKYLIFDGTERV